MLKIGLSDCGEKNRNYEEYLHHIPDSQVLILGKTGTRHMDECDALVLTGGPDIAPELYGDWADETVHVDSERDGFEYRLLDTALRDKKPVLGICRGLQLLNVYFGGTLILDLEKYSRRLHTAISDTEDRYHEVVLTEGTDLKSHIQANGGVVNSAHHQAAERIGSGLMIAARAIDGTVEAVEGVNHSNDGILAVQWHPERVQFDSPFASGVLSLFISHITNKYKMENNI